MTFKYVACDGKMFDTMGECLDYEWTLQCPHFSEVKFYDKNSEELVIGCDEDIYYLVERVVVPTMEAWEALQEYADYSGFLSFYDIRECGEWVWDSAAGKYVKADN